MPKAIMSERLEIGWLNIARVRALCLAVFGYDPEVENWEHSPFHHNESGSQNMTTLAIAGKTAIVPLVDGAFRHEGEVGSQPDNIRERRTPYGIRPSLLRHNVQGHGRRPIRETFVGARPQSRVWTLGVCHDL